MRHFFHTFCHTLLLRESEMIVQQNPSLIQSSNTHDVVMMRRRMYIEGHFFLLKLLKMTDYKY